VALLLQTPPDTLLVRVVVVPVHTLVGPLITSGNTFTVATLVALQPLLNVYSIVAVPTALPVTIPLVPTEAIASSVLDHTPPTEPVSVAVVPMQIDALPTTDGDAITETANVAILPDAL
jgi:hypothetical protein